MWDYWHTHASRHIHVNTCTHTHTHNSSNIYYFVIDNRELKLSLSRLNNLPKRSPHRRKGGKSLMLAQWSSHSLPGDRFQSLPTLHNHQYHNTTLYTILCSLSWDRICNCTVSIYETCKLIIYESITLHNCIAKAIHLLFVMHHLLNNTNF